MFTRPWSIRICYLNYFDVIILRLELYLKNLSKIKLILLSQMNSKVSPSLVMETIAHNFLPSFQDKGIFDSACLFPLYYHTIWPFYRLTLQLIKQGS